MRWKWFGLLWSFIFLAAAYDTYFAWRHRASFDEWEMNPRARWGAGEFGLPAVFAFKFAWLLVAASLSGLGLWLGRPAGRAATILIAACYAILVVHYIATDPREAGELARRRLCDRHDRLALHLPRPPAADVEPHAPDGAGPEGPTDAQPERGPAVSAPLGERHARQLHQVVRQEELDREG